MYKKQKIALTLCSIASLLVTAAILASLYPQAVLCPLVQDPLPLVGQIPLCLLSILLCLPGTLVTLYLGLTRPFPLTIPLVLAVHTTGLSLLLALVRGPGRGLVRRVEAIASRTVRRRSPKVQAVAAVLTEGSPLNVLLLRLSPLVPNNVMSALLALSPLSPFVCVSLSLLGWIPTTVFALWTAAIIRRSIDGWCAGQDEVAGEGEGDAAASLGQTIVFYVVGPLATLAFIIVSSRLAKKKLNLILAEQEAARQLEHASPAVSRTPSVRLQRRAARVDDSASDADDETSLEDAVLSLASSAAAAVDSTRLHGGRESRQRRTRGRRRRQSARRGATRVGRRVEHPTRSASLLPRTLHGTTWHE